MLSSSVRQDQNIETIIGRVKHAGICNAMSTFAERSWVYLQVAAPLTACCYGIRCSLVYVNGSSQQG